MNSRVPSVAAKAAIHAVAVGSSLCSTAKKLHKVAFANVSGSRSAKAPLCAQHRSAPFGVRKQTLCKISAFALARVPLLTASRFALLAAPLLTHALGSLSFNQHASRGVVLRPIAPPARPLALVASPQFAVRGWLPVRPPGGSLNPPRWSGVGFAAWLLAQPSCNASCVPISA